MSATYQEAPITDQELPLLLDAMRKHGGHFASHLAEAWARADLANGERLMASFGPLLATFRRFLHAPEPVRFRPSGPNHNRVSQSIANLNRVWDSLENAPEERAALDEILEALYTWARARGVAEPEEL
jgi:hypothetical protein